MGYHCFAFQEVYGCWACIKSRSCYIAHWGLRNNAVHILIWNIQFLCLKLRLKEKYALVLVCISMVRFTLNRFLLSYELSSLFTLLTPPCWDICVLKLLRVLRVDWSSHWTKEKGLLHLFVLVLTLVCLSLTKDVQVVTNQILVSTAYTYLCRNYFCVNAYVACQPWDVWWLFVYILHRIRVVLPILEHCLVAS